MKLTSIAEAEKALHPYFEVAQETIGKDITLVRTERLMAHLGHPEKQLRIVHIAGTSGKTSTTYYIAALLQQSGLKIGHTVSPHIDSLTERIQIDGLPLTEDKFCTYMGEFLDLIADAPEKPSWFECLIGFAYWVFAREKVDYAVIETGLGGLQDSTNVAARLDKLCVITDIGLDHMNILGTRLGSIAHQKAGIIHKGNAALMFEQADEVMQVVRFWVSQQEGAELYTFTQERLRQVYKQDFLPHLPAYQQRNWLLAYAAYRFLAGRDHFRLIDQAKLLATQQIQVPGRMDVRSFASKTIVMDGAHNAQKMEAFISSYKLEYPDVKPTVLLALKQGKEIAGLAPLLKDFAREVIVTTFSKMQDLPLVSIDPGEIVEVLRKHDILCSAVPNQTDAYKAVLDSADSSAVITGSFFLISQLRETHEELR